MTRTLWPLLTGFILWSLAFIALYALQYLGCYFQWQPDQHRLALVGAYLLSLLLLATWLAFQLMALRRRGTPSATMDRMSIGATIAALAATAITFAPTLIASACL